MAVHGVSQKIKQRLMKSDKKEVFNSESVREILKLGEQYEKAKKDLADLEELLIKEIRQEVSARRLIMNGEIVDVYTGNRKNKRRGVVIGVFLPVKLTSFSIKDIEDRIDALFDDINYDIVKLMPDGTAGVRNYDHWCRFRIRKADKGELVPTGLFVKSK